MAGRIHQARKAFRDKDEALLHKSHETSSIRDQIYEEGHSGSAVYLSEFVYGGMDGAVTTFAVVAGATGAMLAPGIVIILGFANLIADGFSMATGNYISEKTQMDFIRRERAREEWEIEQVPMGERHEIEEIFRKRGLKGKRLHQITDIITSDKDLWVDTMLTYELGLNVTDTNPWKSAVATFLGFLTIGIIPLLSYLLAYIVPYFAAHTFLLAIAMTFVALAAVGYLKAQMTSASVSKGVLQTVLLGGAAAALAYGVGYMLQALA